MKHEPCASEGTGLTLQGQNLPSCLFAWFWIQEAWVLRKFLFQMEVYFFKLQWSCVERGAN